MNVSVRVKNEIKAAAKKSKIKTNLKSYVRGSMQVHNRVKEMKEKERDRKK